MTGILFICMMTWMAVSSTPNPKEKPHQEFKHSLNRRILVLRTSWLVAETYTHACFQTVESDPWMLGSVALASPNVNQATNNVRA